MLKNQNNSLITEHGLKTVFNFIHVSTRNKIKPHNETPEFLTVVLMQILLQGYDAVSTGLVTKVFEELDPTDGGSKPLSNVTMYQFTQLHIPKDPNLLKVDLISSLQQH
jgi:hypothetical protein